jgi:hypothetical protein
MATELQANIVQWGSIEFCLDIEYLEEYLGVSLGYMSGPLPVSTITKE